MAFSNPLIPRMFMGRLASRHAASLGHRDFRRTILASAEPPTRQRVSNNAGAREGAVRAKSRDDAPWPVEGRLQVDNRTVTSVVPIRIHPRSNIYHTFWNVLFLLVPLLATV